MAYGGRSETRITERPLPNMERPTADPPRPVDNRHEAPRLIVCKVMADPHERDRVKVLLHNSTFVMRTTAATKSVKKGDIVGVIHTGTFWEVRENYTVRPAVPVAPPPTGTIPPVSGSTTVPTKNPTPYTPRVLDVPTRTLRAPSGHPSTYTSDWALSVNQAIADLRSSMYDVYDSLRAVEREQRKIQDAIADLDDLAKGTRDATSSINGRVTNAQTAINTASSLVNGTRTTLQGLTAALGPDGERIVK